MRRRNVVLLGAVLAVLVAAGLVVAGELRLSVLPFLIVAVTRLASWIS